ncbi:class I SAM-dependent methyltransferase [Citricoccus sp. SGAir0253]|uniref:class I SAM-dependent methyltransferase n=1 Tax=Citricoccus sp. SGAir0253 TaxID=2567881 RepID=UPI001FEDB399|nr:methyltransferase [Citricoccus sp. SGAir0253]
MTDSSAPPPWGVTPPVGRSPLTEGFGFEALSRWPYPEAPELLAHDAADVLLLDTLHAWWGAGHPGGSVHGIDDASDDGGPGGGAADPGHAVVVLEDRHGALTLPLLAAGHPVRVGQDALAQERSLEANLGRWRAADPDAAARAGALHRGPIDADLVAGARTVLLVLPRSLDALEQWTRLVAEHAAEDVVLLAGGRDKHMTPRQNAVLERHFASVVPGRGRSKSRVLTARGPLRGRPDPFPRTAVRELPGVGAVTLAAYGATFGGAALDPGTALLLGPLAAALAAGGPKGAVGAPARAVDVGCGNGTIAVHLALLAARAGATGAPGREGVAVVATDQSADACRSTALTARLNGVAELVEVRRDDALASFPDASEDLLVLNPPFHAGGTVDPRVALRLVEACARVLRPGGELWCVWNSHLRYRRDLERLVGPTRQVERDRTFTVTVSTRR